MYSFLDRNAAATRLVDWHQRSRDHRPQRPRGRDQQHHADRPAGQAASGPTATGTSPAPADGYQFVRRVRVASEKGLHLPSRRRTSVTGSAQEPHRAEPHAGTWVTTPHRHHVRRHGYGLVNPRGSPSPSAAALISTRTRTSARSSSARRGGWVSSRSIGRRPAPEPLPAGSGRVKRGGMNAAATKAHRPVPQVAELCVQPAPDDAHRVDPIRFTGDPAAALAKLRAVIGRRCRTQIRASTPDSLHAEFTSWLLRFVDDLDAVVDPDAGVIHLRSRVARRLLRPQRQSQARRRDPRGVRRRAADDPSTHQGRRDGVCVDISRHTI